MGKTCSKHKLQYKSTDSLKVPNGNFKHSLKPFSNRENKEKDHHLEKLTFKITLDNIKAKQLSHVIKLYECKKIFKTRETSTYISISPIFTVLLL